jgi:hypothetical protein
LALLALLRRKQKPEGTSMFEQSLNNQRVMIGKPSELGVSPWGAGVGDVGSLLSGSVDELRQWLAQEYSEFADLGQLTDNGLLAKLSEAIANGQLAIRSLPSTTLTSSSPLPQTSTGTTTKSSTPAPAPVAPKQQDSHELAPSLDWNALTRDWMLHPAILAPAQGWSLGQVSRRYEGGGPGTVSSGKGDPGGASYGSWQMSSAPRGGTVGAFVVSSSYKDQFVGLTPGSAEFTAVWKQLAQAQPQQFEQAQHDYIKSTLNDPLVASIKALCSVDVSTRSAGLQDCTWSTAVQHGPGNGATIFKAALHSSNMAMLNAVQGRLYDGHLVLSVYQERGRTDATGALVHFKSSSAQVQQGVASRYERELNDALMEV